MKRAISFILIIAILFTIFPFINVYADVIDDYRDLDWFDRFEINAKKPTAKFRIETPDGRSVISYYGYDFDNNPPADIEVKLGDVIRIIDESVPNSGYSIDKYDFQVYCRNNSSKNVIKDYTVLPNTWVLDEEGIWDFYLCVRDNTPLPNNYGNWSENGRRRSKGPALPDFPDGLWWYFVHIRVNVLPLEKPIADMAFSDTDSTIKYITEGESVTIVDKSYTLDGTDIIGWGVKEGDKPESYITNPDSFFKTYTFYGVGVFTYTLNYVKNSNDIKSTNPPKKLTVVVTPKPTPGQGKVLYEYYKDSVKEENLLGTNEVGISNPFIVFLPDTYGDGLKFSSATYSGEAVADGGNCKNGDTITIVNTTKNLLIQAIYKKEASGPTTYPPTAIIYAKDEVMAGENVRVDGSTSYSNNEGGYIAAYYWDYEGANLIRDNGSNIRIWYPNTGEYTIYLDVEDEVGNMDWTYHYIRVVPPIPTAVIKYTGKLKENRKITIDSSESTSTEYYPIDTSKTSWQITPVSGGTADDIKYEGSLYGNAKKDILFKKAGTYKVRLTVTNTYGRSASTEITLNIQPDLPPIAKIVLPAPEGMIYQVYRDPDDDNYATFEIYNESSSTDGDIIDKAVVFYCYDSDNDGDYKDEIWYYSIDGTTWKPVNMSYDEMVSYFNIYYIANSNVPKFTLKTKEVGKYYYFIRVMETIPDEETIPAFITESDYKRADNFD